MLAVSTRRHWFWWNAAWCNVSGIVGEVGLYPQHVKGICHKPKIGCVIGCQNVLYDKDNISLCIGQNKNGFAPARWEQCDISVWYGKTWIWPLEWVSYCIRLTKWWHLNVMYIAAPCLSYHRSCHSKKNCYYQNVKIHSIKPKQINPNKAHFGGLFVYIVGIISMSHSANKNPSQSQGFWQ